MGQRDVQNPKHQAEGRLNQVGEETDRSQRQSIENTKSSSAGRRDEDRTMQRG